MNQPVHACAPGFREQYLQLPHDGSLAQTKAALGTVWGSHPHLGKSQKILITLPLACLLNNTMYFPPGKERKSANVPLTPNHLPLECPLVQQNTFVLKGARLGQPVS